MTSTKQVGDTLKCIDTKIAEGFDVAPPLELGKEYSLKEIITDEKGNHHFDVGLVSKYNWITSRETQETLERGNKIHWCHPSRFE
jgi:hypothetical protein